MDMKEKCKWLRHEILDILSKSKKGHVGGALSCVEILVALYYGGLLREQDKFILSKGHVSMALYPILHDKGFISDEIYENCYMNGNPLGGHPDTNTLGVEVDSGSLGHGLGIACGMALADKDRDVYVLMGDGECNEGSVWESILFAAKQKLGNVILIVDKNNICATDFLKNASSLQHFSGALRQLEWAVTSIDGHNIDEILAYISKVRRIYPDQPIAVVASTVKGKGVSYMENSPKWHHGVPNEEQLEIARREIDGS